MGKRLIIKGADFSQNGIYSQVSLWYITGYDDNKSNLSSTANTANGGWAFGDTDQNKVRGKVINQIKFKVSAAGDFPIMKGSARNSMTEAASITIEQAEIGTVVTKTFTPVTVGESEYIAVGKPNGAGMYFTSSSSATPSGFYTKVPSSPTSTTGNLGVNVGFIDNGE